MGTAMVYGMRGAGFALLIATSATPVEAQNCEAIMRQLLSGGADVGWAQRAQDYLNRNCSGNQPQPSIPQPSYPTYNPQPTYQTPNPLPNYQTPNAVVQEFAKIGEFIMRGQPLRKDIPLSSGVMQMENVKQPPPAPQNYVDPFAAGTFTPPTQSSPVLCRRGGAFGTRANRYNFHRLRYLLQRHKPRRSRPVPLKYVRLQPPDLIGPRA
jgi:hypothetical protein